MTEFEVVDLKLSHIIKKVEEINSDKDKQSFGNLLYLEKAMKDTLDNRLYVNDEWSISTPRWLGEWGNTQEEEELLALLHELTFLVADTFRGGWGDKKD